MRVRLHALLTGAVLLGAAATVHAATLEREFRIDASRLTLRQQAGITYLDARGGLPEFEAGMPDLPRIAERIELPIGQRVARVEVLDVETELLDAKARVATSIVQRPGLGATERTAPDAGAFAHRGFLPERIVDLAQQGFARGRNLAYLQIGAARWNPTSGRLERVRRVRVRLTLAATADRPVERERVVSAWEDGVTESAGMRALSARSLGGERLAGPFVPQQLPSVLGSPVAYLIVTSDALAPTFQTLADYKTQNGVPAVVRTMSFVRAQYPFGSDDAEKLRLFLRDAYARWGTKWVLLGGDTDVVPARLARTTFYGGEWIPTDMYFQCLDGNWNADGDSLYGEGFYSSEDVGDDADLLPELHIGRAPVSTITEAQVFVNKTLQYTRFGTGQEERILAFAEVLFPQEWQPGLTTSLDGAELVEELWPGFDQRPCLRVSRLYENHLDPRWRPGPVQETRQRVLDSLNTGPNLAIHVGHGYRNTMSVGNDNMTNADATGLTNGNRLINLYAINCTSTAIDFPCIGEAFMKNPNGGAVTNLGSTRFDFPTAGRVYQQEYFRLMIEDSVDAVGELQSRQKYPFVLFSSYDGVNRWTQFTLLLLGDPELRVRLCTPRTLTVAHASSMALNDTAVTVQVNVGAVPLAGARVTVYRAGDELSVGTTDAAGLVTLPFRPDQTGSASVTVNAYNSLPYQGTLTITPAGPPVLAEQAATIDDDNVGGTAGNSNGQVDAGEVVDVRVPLRNNGGSAASAVTATLTTTDPLVSVTTPTAAYGTIGAGATVSPAGAFRVSFPFDLADQREVPFTVSVVEGGRTHVEAFRLTVLAPELVHYSHTIVDSPGDNDGRPEPGETVAYTLQLRNNGTGFAEQVTAKLRSYDGLSTVTDSTATLGNIASGATGAGDAFVFVPTSLFAKLSLIVSDRWGVLFEKPVDLLYPGAPISLIGTGSATSIALTWAHSVAPDLRGYNIYRSTLAAGPFAKVNLVPTGATSYFLDENLAPLTRYYYRVTAVDSSGNESSQSGTANASTNPPRHAIFPVPTGRETPSSVALERIYGGGLTDIVVGSEKLYVLRSDGSAPVDADGAGATLGDFSTRGSYFAAGPSVANLDGTGWSIVAPSWDSLRVYVFDQAGAVRPGWPLVTSDAVWSSAAIGDLDNNGVSEMVFGSNGNRFYAMRHDGSEWLDGDANAGTKGVFKVLGQPFNFGTPALADLDNDNQLEIVFGSYDGKLYVWRQNGTNFPGFPFTVPTNSSITSSAAIGYLDGPGDPTPEIVFAAANESLYVLGTDGKRRTNWPLWTRTTGVSKTPSPALADVNQDGFLDVVWQSTNGGAYVFNRDATVQPGKSNMRYSTLTNSASESSPVVADINGDSFPDIVLGDEFGLLSAFSGLNGALLPGFPIQLGGEVRGAPALGDIDNDGKSEIVVASWDKQIYVWDYDFPFNPTGTPAWPQFHHDARRTGFYNAPIYVDAGDSGAGGRGPAAIEFARPQPNPARGRTRLTFGVPADLAGGTYEIAVYDLSGRRVQRIDSGLAHAGRFSAEWNLRDESGRPVDGGVYFVRYSLGGMSLSQKLVVMR